MENQLFNTYLPKHFCREFVEIKGNSLQLGMYMALVLGIKPLMDDWVPVGKLRQFKKICKEYGLKCREDIIFDNIAKDKLPANVLAAEYLTTTSAYGFPLGSRKSGDVHLFISKDEAILRKGMWYPVVIKDRVMFQPRIDTLKYGYALGYPECCIKFFRKYNNWLKYSYLYQAYLNTKGPPSFFCNPFLKDTSFSYIYHMPCSYSCRQTIKLASRLRRGINKMESGYVKIIDKLLKMPFLVFYEKKFYCFKGKLEGNLLKYDKACFLFSRASENLFAADFDMADALELKGRRITLFRKNHILNIVDVFLNEFAPEYPFLIKFF